MANKKYNHISSEYIIEQYVEQKRSTLELAQELQVSAWLITDRLKQANIKLRRQGGGIYTIDLENQRFGNYRVVRKIDKIDNPQGAFWQVLCDCGNVRNVLSHHLRSGQATSCGECKDNYNWAGVGEMSGSYYDNLKAGAIRRKLTFNVNKNYLWDLFIKQNKKCALTGLDIWFVKNFSGKKRSANTASVDRIDSTKGYEEGNVQWVHKVVNIIKWNLEQQYFIDICRKVVDYYDEGKGID